MTITGPMTIATAPRHRPATQRSPGPHDEQEQLHEQAGQPEHRIDEEPTDDHEHGP